MHLKYKLSPIEARVIGVLIEKEITTPDQYPLSLNALTNGCNQKSNREPVLDLSEQTVQETVDGLIKKFLARSHSGYGSRVAKYQHRLCNAEFDELKLSAQELGIICELLLRGPQTPGELRTRVERLCRLTDVNQVEAVLHHLMERDPPLVTRLSRQPGKRESRYAHLLGDETFSVAEPEHETAARIGTESTMGHSRIEALEHTVRTLQSEIKELKEMLELLMETKG